MNHDVYVYLAERQEVTRTRALREGINLDLDAAGNPLGVEILDAHSVVVDGIPARKVCSAYHPEYGFTCVIPQEPHPGTHYDMAGGHWNYERGQVWSVVDVADMLEQLASPTVAHGKWILGQLARHLREAIADAQPAPGFPVQPLMLRSGVLLLFLVNLQHHMRALLDWTGEERIA